MITRSSSSSDISEVNAASQPPSTRLLASEVENHAAFSPLGAGVISTAGITPVYLLFGRKVPDPGLKRMFVATLDT